MDHSGYEHRLNTRIDGNDGFFPKLNRLGFLGSKNRGPWIPFPMVHGKRISHWCFVSIVSHHHYDWITRKKRNKGKPPRKSKNDEKKRNIWKENWTPPKMPQKKSKNHRTNNRAPQKKKETKRHGAASRSGFTAAASMTSCQTIKFQASKCWVLMLGLTWFVTWMENVHKLHKHHVLAQEGSCRDFFCPILETKWWGKWWNPSIWTNPNGCDTNIFKRCWNQVFFSSGHNALCPVCNHCCKMLDLLQACYNFRWKYV